MTELIANKTRKRTVENWETISVTALPVGWANVFEPEDDDEATTIYVPCPALLLQELRSVTHCTDWLAKDGSKEWTTTDGENLAPPYNTRVVAGDLAEGWMRPAEDMHNHLGTIYRPDLFRQEEN